eukprot:scaffold1770_cov375-Prasinococcus_capsulatus_cf.AAC.14
MHPTLERVYHEQNGAWNTFGKTFGQLQKRATYSPVSVSAQKRPEVLLFAVSHSPMGVLNSWRPVLDALVVPFSWALPRSNGSESLGSRSVTDVVFVEYAISGYMCLEAFKCI